MQPVLFSVTEAKHGRSGWVRASTEVSYYRNRYSQAVSEEQQNEKDEEKVSRLGYVVTGSNNKFNNSTKFKKKTAADELSGFQLNSEEIK